jgi:FtsH-binding integral membrane protein
MAKPNTNVAIDLQRTFFNRVFSWMTLGLLATGVTSMYVASSPALIQFFLGNTILFFGLILLELFAVGFLAAKINSMSEQQASMLFIGYSILNGITLSGIFLMYTGASIALAFFVTAGTFATMTVYGYTTKSDLSEMGKLMFMGLIGIIIASIINIFLKSSAMEYIISYVGVAVFIGLTAWDVQKLKLLSENASEQEHKNLAIYGALTLYMDFINLFIFMLRILGNRSRDY